MGARPLAQIAADLRHAVRTLRGMPRITIVVVLSLAIAIGVNTVVFSWIQARVLRPLPGVGESGSFLLVEARTDTGGFPALSWQEYLDLRGGLPAIPSLVAARSTPLYVGRPPDVERVSGQLVSDNYFSELRIAPAAGRLLTPEDGARAASEAVAVISHGLWQSRFGGAPVAGRTLFINNQEVAIVGVAPPEFQGTVLGLYFDVWLPAESAPLILAGSREITDRGMRGYLALGRLSPAATREDAQAQLTSVMARLSREYPATNSAIRGEILGIRESPRGPRMAGALYVLQGIMLLLLLAVCGNVSNLLLARASARQREVAVRLALGAPRWRIVSMMAAEGVILSAAGALLGALLAVWGTNALMAVPLTGLPIRFQTSVDGIGLAVAMSLGFAAGLLSSAAPALQLARLNPQPALRTGVREAARGRVRDVLMGLQAAFAVVVLIVAALFVQSFLETRDMDPGFRRDGVLLAGYDLRGRAATGDAMRAFADNALRRLQAQPGIEAAAISSSVPLDIHGLPARMFMVEGRAREDGTFDQASTNTVTRGYFDLMGIPFREGRDFAEMADPAAPPQAIVNDAFVARYLGGLAPVGRIVTTRGREFVITGVVGDSLSNAYGEPPTPVLYLSYRDNPQPLGEIHVRVAGDVMTFAPAVRAAIRDVNPELPLFNVRSLSAHVETNLVFRRVPARMFMVLGPLLLVLAAIGIYASVAYTATLRTREMGVRLALGAAPAKLTVRFIAEHLWVIGLGIAAGWGLAALVIWKRATAVSVPGLSFILVPAALILVAAISCAVPARRATRVSPLAAMRDTG